MAEKPLILVFTTAYKPFVGGAELAIQEITRRLKEKYNFVIITGRFQRTLKKEEVFPEGKVIRLGVGVPFLDKLLLPFLGFFFVIWKLKIGNWELYVRQHRIILWGIMISYASIAAYFVKIFYRATPFVITLQEGNREWERFPSKWWWLIILKKVDHVSSISNFLAERAREKGYKGKISIVPNGVDEGFLNIHSGNNSLSSRLNPSRVRAGSDADSNSKRFSRFVIFSASRLVYKNGIDLLIAACAKLKDTFNFRIVLAGDGYERQNLELQSQKLGIEDRVEFLGTVPYEQLLKYYAKADIFIRPSRSEGLGSAFLEAMASGLITIGTSVGGIPDFLKDGQTGFLAKPEDADNLANVIRKVFALSEKEKYDITKNAKSEISKRFLWGSVSAQMDNIFLSELQCKQ